jgi:PAS domain-containing protein
LFVLEAQIERQTLLGTSVANRADIPDSFSQIALRAGRRLKARVPPRLVRGRLPKAQRHIIEEVSAWNSLREMQVGYVAGQLLRIWEDAYLCIGIGEDSLGAGAPLQDRQAADMLLPHLARAAALERMLQSASAEFSLFTQILDRFPIAVISLDGRRTVAHLNRAALRLVEQGALSVSSTEVHAFDKGEDATLQTRIDEAIGDTTGEYVARLHLGSRRGAACGLVVMSIRWDGSRWEGRPRCVLLVADSNLEPNWSPAALCDFLGLTMAEARLVAEVAVRGLSVPEASRKIGVAPNTGRTLIARAMARTGTNSQLGLLRKVFNTVVPIAEEI